MEIGERLTGNKAKETHTYTLASIRFLLAFFATCLLLVKHRADTCRRSINNNPAPVTSQRHCFKLRPAAISPELFVSRFCCGADGNRRGFSGLCEASLGKAQPGLPEKGLANSVNFDSRSYHEYGGKRLVRIVWMMAMPDHRRGRQ